jgi:hypothetical protein
MIYYGPTYDAGLQVMDLSQQPCFEGRRMDLVSSADAEPDRRHGVPECLGRRPFGVVERREFVV